MCGRTTAVSQSIIRPIYLRLIKSNQIANNLSAIKNLQEESLVYRMYRTKRDKKN